jgi:hypothetical protein
MTHTVDSATGVFSVIASRPVVISWIWEIRMVEVEVNQCISHLIGMALNLHKYLKMLGLFVINHNQEEFLASLQNYSRRWLEPRFGSMVALWS